MNSSALLPAMPTQTPLALTPHVRRGIHNHRCDQHAHIAFERGDERDVPAANERITVHRTDEQRREALSTRGLFGVASVVPGIGDSMS
jgi:hypothetical protein